MSAARTAQQVSREFASEEAAQFLRVMPREDGKIRALCCRCPKRVRDTRGDVGGVLSANRRRNWAVSSFVVVDTKDAALAWFDAHRRTEIHAHYLAPEAGRFRWASVTRFTAEGYAAFRDARRAQLHSVACPACKAGAGESCVTQRRTGGWVPVQGVHKSRKAAASW